ncbi:hypothetical protein BC941DRAFT_514254 [Chlamydoabsidia padenii]|nr:hypothetical protein BC941DRAFT_514254 [Chlamydoabsidia padenii]
MDNNKVFRDRDLIGICHYLVEYCENYICTATVSTEHASAFHTFLPTLLTSIFGSPTVRGWLQTETRPEQDDAIRKLLDPKGVFLASLIKLGAVSTYCYNMTFERLPDDIRRALAAGAIEYLPRVYENCTFLDVSKVTTTLLDLRSSATRQSSIFPRPSKGEFRIRFNMVQFYLYYMVAAATWTPTTQSTAPMNSKPNYPTTTTTATATTTTTTTLTIEQQAYLIPGPFRPLVAGIYPDLIRNYMHVYIPCVVNDSAPYINGVGTFFLDTLVELWLRTVWISSSQKLSNGFIYCLAGFIKYVVGGDLRRCATWQNYNNTSPTRYTDVYRSIKDELYLLLSRLALNWRKQDDYIWVLNLWTIWATPWRLGNILITKDGLQQQQQQEEGKGVTGSLNMDLTPSPLDEGWAYFILDNGWYYLTLVDTFLQRISTFTYPDKVSPPPLLPSSSNTNITRNGNPPTTYNRPTYSAPPPPPPPTSSPLDGDSIYGELDIFNQLVSIWKLKDMVVFLGMIEDGLDMVTQELALSENAKSATTHSTARTTSLFLTSGLESAFSMVYQKHQQNKVNPETLINLSRLCCISDGSDLIGVKQQLQWLHERIISVLPLNLTQSQPTNIYSTNRQSRSDHLVKSLEALESAVDKRRHPGGKSLVTSATSWLGQKKVPTMDSAPSNEIKSLSSMASKLSSLLKLPLPSRSSAVVDTNIITPVINHENRFSAQPSASSASLNISDTIPIKPRHCQHPVIKPLGPRAEETVRSYESKYLVSWIVPLDRSVNAIYRRWLYHPCLPDRITFRWFATPINLIYLILFLASICYYKL